LDLKERGKVAAMRTSRMTEDPNRPRRQEYHDLLEEKPFPLAEVPDHVPRKRGRKIHRATAFRWAAKGVGGVVLETVRCGRTKFTSEPALRRFYERLNQRGPGGASRARSPGRRQKEYERAMTDLRKLGLKV
jgi:hypothetical protein